MLIISSSNPVITYVKYIISRQYKMKDIGRVNQFLGININYKQREGMMMLDKCAKIDRMLKGLEWKIVKEYRPHLRRTFQLFFDNTQSHAMIQSLTERQLVLYCISLCILVLILLML